MCVLSQSYLGLYKPEKVLFNPQLVFALLWLEGSRVKVPRLKVAMKHLREPNFYYYYYYFHFILLLLFFCFFLFTLHKRGNLIHTTLSLFWLAHTDYVNDIQLRATYPLKVPKLTHFLGTLLAQEKS